MARIFGEPKQVNKKPVLVAGFCLHMKLLKYIALFLIFFAAVDAVIGKDYAVVHEEDRCSYVEGLTDFNKKKEPIESSSQENGMFGISLFEKCDSGEHNVFFVAPDLVDSWRGLDDVGVEDQPRGFGKDQ
ncbi:hypothetical protein JMN32_22455 [Fulvivirga sp. 29W222]|uniref:Uncharacterized protein n=1 Tax=Fulvivirga marina TaxID=2494733 RepID=A0A937KG71_9BACT|nr:hypothetical protein [Fulvivirga marina]MBL6449090.1 hypothetical protein [Fulvivirga marina]